MQQSPGQTFRKQRKWRPVRWLVDDHLRSFVQIHARYKDSRKPELKPCVSDKRGKVTRANKSNLALAVLLCCSPRSRIWHHLHSRQFTESPKLNYWTLMLADFLKHCALTVQFYIHFTPGIVEENLFATKCKSGKRTKFFRWRLALLWIHYCLIGFQRAIHIDKYMFSALHSHSSQLTLTEVALTHFTVHSSSTTQ